MKENALDAMLKLLAANENLTPEERDELCTAARQIAMDTYKHGIKQGYLKILQDHRDGFIHVPSSGAATINQAIQNAKDGVLSPSDCFKP